MKQSVSEYPQDFGEFVLLNKIAAGGMAAVYTAKRSGGHDIVKLLAIKRIHAKLCQDSEFVEMFIEEARICSHLNHRCIVSVHELGKVDARLFMAMELVEGLDLLQVMKWHGARKEFLEPEVAVHIASEILDALSYAHHAVNAKGKPLEIIHRDVTPGNILLSRQGAVKLTDFGIARASDNAERTIADNLKGKYSYMPPEHIVGLPIDGRADVFSMGVVLSEMLMGRRLFTAANDYDVLMMVSEVRLDRLDKHGWHIDPSLRTILEKALKRDPKARYNAQEFRAALAAWTQQQDQQGGQRQVAELVEKVEGLAEEERPASLSGPLTKERQQQDELDGKEANEQDSPDAKPVEWHSDFDTVADGPPAAILFEQAKAATEAAAKTIEVKRLPSEPPVATGIADISVVSPLRLLFGLSQRGADGRLEIELSSINKTAYFRDGDAYFVESNLASETLAAVLLNTGKISNAELTMAQAVMPSFDNSLEKTLVGLGLAEPRDLIRTAVGRVRLQLVDFCSWTKGTASWFQGEIADEGVDSARVDTFEVLGRGALALEPRFVSEWASKRPDAPIDLLTSDLDAKRFALGSRIDFLRSLCDGRRTIRDIQQLCPSQAAWIDTLRVLYLMEQTELATLRS